MLSSVLRLLFVSIVVTLASQAWAQEVMETTQPVADHAAEHTDSGLPQLDVSTFPNQLFWLLICGVALYILMAKVALPRVQNIMRARDHFVHDHLQRAAALRLKTEDAKVNYDLAIQGAEKKAKDVLTDTVATMKQKHEQTLQDVLKNIAARTQAAEQQIQADKDKTMASLDKNAAQLADEIMLAVFDMKPAKI